jgi:hypothetical protein
LSEICPFVEDAQICWRCPICENAQFVKMPIWRTCRYIVKIAHSLKMP